MVLRVAAPWRKVLKHRHIFSELLICFLRAQAIVVAIKSNSSEYLTPALFFTQSFNRKFNDGGACFNIKSHTKTKFSALKIT